MSEVWPELRKLFPELVIVCRLLEKNILEPIMNNGTITMAMIKIDIENSSLLSMILDAVEEAGEDTTVDISDVEVDDNANNEVDSDRDKVMGNHHEHENLFSFSAA